MTSFALMCLIQCLEGNLILVLKGHLFIVTCYPHRKNPCWFIVNTTFFSSIHKVIVVITQKAFFFFLPKCHGQNCDTQKCTHVWEISTNLLYTPNKEYTTHPLTFSYIARGSQNKTTLMGYSFFEVYWISCSFYVVLLTYDILQSYRVLSLEQPELQLSGMALWILLNPKWILPTFLF